MAAGTRSEIMICVFSTVVFLLTKRLEFVDGAQGLFVFGDSYTAAKLGVASPTPWESLDESASNCGANFGVGGAAVTPAYGWRPLHQQVDRFQAMLQAGAWSADHLAQSVAVVSIGVNDYFWYKQKGNGIEGVAAFVNTVVGQMGTALQRIQALGIRNILVDNLVPMACMPFATLYVNGETGCVANNALLETETSLHDQQLQAKVDQLNAAGANIVMLDLTKALRNVFENGAAYGFTEAYKRCCTGSCGSSDACADPSKHVMFDSTHPTDAAWKAVTDLYTYTQGHTKGQTLAAWIQTNDL